MDPRQRIDAILGRSMSQQHEVAECNAGDERQKEDAFAHSRQSSQLVHGSVGLGQSRESYSEPYRESEQRQYNVPSHERTHDSTSRYSSLQAQSSSVGGMPPTTQQHAAMELVQGDTTRMSARNAGQAQQAAAAAAMTAKPVMYVKPPWAINDPFQVRNA